MPQTTSFNGDRIPSVAEIEGSDVLTDRQKHVLVQILHEGRAGADIARELGVSKTTVSNIKNAAIERLNEYARTIEAQETTASPLDLPFESFLALYLPGGRSSSNFMRILNHMICSDWNRPETPRDLVDKPPRRSQMRNIGNGSLADLKEAFWKAELSFPSIP